MALLVPTDPDAFENAAEEEFCRFLERDASGDRFIVWYQPKVNNESGDTEPDFLLFHPDQGLVVVEVKAWSLEQVLDADPVAFRLQIGGREETRTNPYAQARDYYIALRTRIQRDRRLVSTHPASMGKGKVPITYGVALPNILRKDVIDSGWDDGVIPRDRVFFHEDLAPGSAWHGNFLPTLQARFPAPFPCVLSQEEIRHLRQVIFPVVRIPKMDRGAAPDRVVHEERVALLDRAQESAARKAFPGVRLVVGPAGSGKTLVLVHQAAFLAERGAAKRILYLCFNTAIVTHVRRLLAAKGLPREGVEVEVLPFFDLCERLLGDAVHHEREGTDYYAFVTEAALALGDVGEGNRYDAILVDEGQDFDTGMLRVAMRCLEPKGGIMTIALDEGQDLYGRVRDWEALGIAARGKTVTRLGECYRATNELSRFAERFAHGGGEASSREGAAGSGGAPSQGDLFPVPSPTHGPKPELLRHASFEAMVAWMVRLIREMQDGGGYSLSEIGVVYAHRRYPASQDEGPSLPEVLGKAFLRAGILSRWIAGDHRARREHDVTTDSVAITTVHSAKGLDHACVFLLGLDELEPTEGRGEDALRRTAYVGLTRARYRLLVPYLAENGLIRELKECL